MYICSGSSTGQMSSDSLYVVNRWVTCCTQRTCHNIFYTLVYVPHSGMKTRQNWPDLSHHHHLPDPISLHRPQDVHTAQISDAPLDSTPQPFCSVCVHCYWLVCAKLCLFVFAFVLCPVLLGVTCPLTRCLVLFILLAVLTFALLLVLGVSVQHICVCVYIHSCSYASRRLGHPRIIQPFVEPHGWCRRQG